MSSDEGETNERIKRRTVLKAAGVAVVGGAGATGRASAHQMHFFGCNEVCTDTDGNFAVVSVDGGYEGRELTAAAERDDVGWTHDNTYCYAASADEYVVGFVEEDVYRGDEKAGDGCTLCLNPNDCAANHYDDPQEIIDDLNDDDTVDVCHGKLSVGDCEVFESPADGDGDEDDAWPMTEFDAQRTNFNPDASGISGEPSVDWEYDLTTTEDRVFDHSAAVAADGSVYVAESTGDLGARLLSLDATDGSVEWEANYDRGDRLYPRAVHDGVVYVQLWNSPSDSVDTGDIVAIDADDGSERWRTTITYYDVILEDLIVADAVYSLNSGAASHIRKLDLESGEEQWSTSVSYTPYVQLAVKDDRLFANSDDLVALSTATGNTEWRVEFDGTEPRTIVAGDGVVHAAFNHAEEALKTFDAATGDLQWSRQRVDNVHVLADGLLYGGDADEVQIVDAETGDLAETFDEGMIPEAATEDTLYGFATESTDAPLKALDRNSGELRWQTDEASHADWAGAEWIPGDVLALDGTIYAPGADEHTLVRLSSGDEESD
ncbi:outer membrane protein assembly factor BamB family protein [Halosimplex amylolyticum]|uniref:outer membrane protein assembly factor BamB family protein n=1 Tax=Halosimplex amylolyticum TaxID=3396616 RepID=UPI003F56F183